MKQIFIIITVFLCISSLAQNSNHETKGRIGIALNSSTNGEVYPIRVIPSITFLKGNHQLELGVGLHPIIKKDQRILSGDFNYKYFPNGITKKFNLYFLAALSYTNGHYDRFFPVTYHHLFLNGGYGFQVTPFKNAYLGTNISMGTFTYQKRSDVPYNTFQKVEFFEKFGLNMAFQFNFGYRF